MKRRWRVCFLGAVLSWPHLQISLFMHLLSSEDTERHPECMLTETQIEHYSCVGGVIHGRGIASHQTLNHFT